MKKVLYLVSLCACLFGSEISVAQHGMRRVGQVNSARGGAATGSGVAAYSSSHAALFGGTNEITAHGDIAAMSGATRFVISLWFLDPVPGATEHLLGHWSPNNGILVRSGSSNRLFLFMGGGASAPFATSNVALSTSDYSHICISYDGSGALNTDKVKFWFNGADQTGNMSFSAAMPAALGDAASDWVFGGDDTTPTNLLTEGYLDEVALWIGGSPPTCLATYNAGVLYDLTTGITPIPTHCWDFNGDSATTANGIEDRCGVLNGLAHHGTGANMEAGDITGANVAP